METNLTRPLGRRNNSSMEKHSITLSEPLSRTVEAQVKLGRYKDFSDAIQDAAWNYFVGPTPFEEYGVTPAEVERAHKKVSAEVERERKSGKLKPWGK